MSNIEPTYKLSTILQFLELEYGEFGTVDNTERGKQIIGRLNQLEADNK